MAEEVKSEIVNEGMILEILKKIEKSDDVKIVQFSTGSQFHQHFMSSIFANILLPMATNIKGFIIRNISMLVCLIMSVPIVACHCC